MEQKPRKEDALDAIGYLIGAPIFLYILYKIIFIW